MDLKTNKGEIIYLLKPVLILVLLLAAIFSISVFGVKQIKMVLAKNEESKQLENALTEKILILENVPVEISGDTTFLDVVMPSKSASIYGLSQIKMQAAQNNLIVSNVKSGSLSANALFTS